MTDMDNQKDNNIKDISLSGSPIRWARYVSIKGQKLTQALYLVTSLLPDSEPLKWRLRDISLDILSDIGSLQLSNLDSFELNNGHQISPLFKVTVLESTTVKISQLISWLDISLAGNFVSEMNISLLRNEYFNFNQLLQEKIKLTGLNKLIDPSQEELLPVPNLSNLSHKKEVNSIGQNEQVGHSYQKISHLPHKNRDVAKDSRRSLIVAFLKGKDWTSIKDITEAISGCSAKTIQRELSDLVHQGVLKKKGDRRWSRYLLA